MIEFNLNDGALTEVRTAAKLINVATKNNFRIYGLKKEDNPLIQVDCRAAAVPAELEKTIKNFFGENNLPIEFNEDDNDRVFIGLRRDLRDHVELSSAIVQTLVYAIEGRIKLEDVVKINDLPKFDTYVPKEKEKKNEVKTEKVAAKK